MVLLTRGFPHGKSERSFIQPELNALDHNFHLSAIISYDGKLEVDATGIPEFTELISFANSNDEPSKKEIGKLFKPFLMWWTFNTFFKSLLGLRFSEFKQIVSQMLVYLRMASFIHAYVKENKVDVLYSYWFDHWSVAMSLYKRLYNSEIFLVSRVHRFEIDLKTTRFSYFPFERINIRCINRISFISEKWKNIFMRRNPDAHEDQCKVHYLGTESSSVRSPVPQNNEQYHILSISGHIPVKNMDLQLKLLKDSGLKIHWHHFGAKTEDKRLEQATKGSNVEYNSYGFVDIAYLKKWMQSNPIHYLLSSSKIEGIPVSMMEAASMGIPIVAMDVGGVSEIVNSKTGILMSYDWPEDQIQEVFKKALTQYSFDYSRRDQIIDFQHTYFDAGKNHNQFFKDILHMMNS